MGEWRDGAADMPCLLLTNIDVAAVVLHALLGAATGLLLLLPGLDLGGLALHLSGTCERSVNFSHFRICVVMSVGGGGRGRGGAGEG